MRMRSYSNDIEKLIIGAPFGNWIQCVNYTTPTLGTYTAAYRGGKLKQLWRLLSTVRFYPAIGGCVNKLGLPNPGIDHLLRKLNSAYIIYDKIISISGRDNPSWMYLLTSLQQLHLRRLAVELNTSCPNCPGEPDTSSYPLIFQKAVEMGFNVSVKLPPLGYEKLAAQAVDAGVNYLHCCNTFPTRAGGMSGKPLQLLSLAACRWCSNLCANTTTRIIGGGGITGMDDVKRFRDAGATRYATASAWFNPLRWPGLSHLALQVASFD